jgi:beta-aspartyl-peptidase (threonine type)
MHLLARGRAGWQGRGMRAPLRVLLPGVLAMALTLPLLRAQKPAPADPVAAIRRLLDDQVAAWNRGDLEGYMAGYWRSPALTFYAGATITTGWQPTLDRYRKRYQGEGQEMGRLAFDDLRIEVLAPDAALARGIWRLTTRQGRERRGLFTVLLKRLPEGWRVTHDHSSGE